MCIDPAFLTTSQAVGELALCHVRLQDDARFPWLILLPRVAGARELEDVPQADHGRLVAEMLRAADAARALGAAAGRPVEKLNVGALGNITPQLHIHVIGRRADDPAWPGPVWGFGKPEPYGPERLAVMLAAARRALAL